MFTTLNSVISKALKEFEQKLLEEHKIVISPNIWTTSGCQVILKTGPRKGVPCGKKLAIGKCVCSAHAKNGATPANSPAVKPVVNTTDPERVTAKKSKYGNFVWDKIVLDKNTKKAVGHENDDGTIVPLTDEERARCVRSKVPIAEIVEKKKEAEEETEELQL